MADPSVVSCGLTPHPVPPSLLFEHARAAVSAAVSAVWPDEPVVLGPHLPSVTNYVTALDVNGAGYIAKYSMLGTSLVSVVRGVCGDWATAEAAQRDYVRDTHSQLARERAQLRILAAHTRCAGSVLRVPRAIALQDGVLITAAATGHSLGAELLRGRRTAAALLASVAAAASLLHRDRALAAAAIPALLAHPHTSIAGTYARKFLSPASDRNLTTLGTGWADAARRRIQHALAALRPTLAPLLRRGPDTAVIYGDLKPEHVLLAGGEVAQTWIDPGLQRADATAELAKLVSRVALLLVTAQPSPARIAAIADTLDALVTAHLAGNRHPGALHTLRRLLALWLADWASYLASGLSLPPESGLELPSTVLAAAGQAGPLLTLTIRTAAQLVPDPARAWGIALGDIRCLATGEQL